MWWPLRVHLTGKETKLFSEASADAKNVLAGRRVSLLPAHYYKRRMRAYCCLDRVWHSFWTQTELPPPSSRGLPAAASHTFFPPVWAPRNTCEGHRPC